MNMSAQTRLVTSSSEPWFDVFGPLQQYLVAPADVSGAFALIRVIVPPSVAIPLHSHVDPEAFFVLEGAMEVLRYQDGVSRWLPAGVGDLVCVPGCIRHAIRNSSTSRAVILIAATPKIYECFQELGKPYDAGQPVGPPTEADMQRLLALASKYDYWIGSPQENEAIGLKL
jgi:quercetin dioxygenase-like cupin family protein